MTKAPSEVSTNFQKYQTANPVMRGIIQRFVDRVVETCEEIGPRRVVDLGCGEGIVAHDLLRRLPGIEYLGIDASAEAIEVAKSLNPEAKFKVGSIFDEADRPGWADLVVCLEVLEHLEDPGGAVVQSMKWTSRHALFSVPWEPWFRAGNFLRGKYLSHLGNHPEHLHQFSPRRFRRLMRPLVGEISVSTCFPWIIAQATGH